MIDKVSAMRDVMWQAAHGAFAAAEKAANESAQWAARDLANAVISEDANHPSIASKANDYRITLARVSTIDKLRKQVMDAMADAMRKAVDEGGAK
jgi:hypothetical protein